MHDRRSARPFAAALVLSFLLFACNDSRHAARRSATVDGRGAAPEEPTTEEESEPAEVRDIPPDDESTPKTGLDAGPASSEEDTGPEVRAADPGADASDGNVAMPGTDSGAEGGIDRGLLTDATQDAAWESPEAGADAAALDASAPRLAPPEAGTARPARECPADANCPVGYPCIVSDDAAGYQCRGLIATWPIAEKIYGAKATPKFTVYADQDVVLDEVTGLLWQRTLPRVYEGCAASFPGSSPPRSACTPEEAEAYCAQLTLADRAWRVPTKVELESLLDFVSAPAEQMLDPRAFPRTDPSYVWTSSLCNYAQDSNYVVSFSVGITVSRAWDRPALVRCVHSERVASGPPRERFVVDPNRDAVFDRYTLLEWQRHPSESALSPDAVEADCAAAGFRVPSIKELKSLVDVTAPFELDPKVFPAIPWHWAIWSKTHLSIGGTLVFVPYGGVEFTDFFVQSDPDLSPVMTLRALCVR